MDTNQTCALIAIVGIVVVFIYQYAKSIFEAH